MDIKNNPEILVKYLSGECSVDEEKIIEAWLNSSEENRKTLELLKKVWTKKPINTVYQNPEEAWIRFAEKAGLVSKSNYRNKNIYRTYMRYAAALLIILLPFLYFSNIFNTGKQELEFKEFAVKKGSRESIVLLDGSKITLDAGSTLRYPAVFEEDKREVFLEGEAYFEVASDQAKPFIVTAGQARIKVLGTKFNVRNWKETEKVILTVAEGKVSFKNFLNDSSEVILTGSELSTIQGNNTPEMPRKIDVKLYLAWMKNEIYFENIPLKEVISQLERWYDVTVILKNESAKNDSLTINIRNKSYRENFDFLALVSGYSVSYQGKVITLY